jgi:organic radical activating enzyme
MGYLLAAKELLKYRYPSIVHGILRVKQLIKQQSKPNNIGDITPLWSIFLTYTCTSDCSYCVQNYSFERGRKDSPLKGMLAPEIWLRLNDVPGKSESIVITGGEPFLYKKLEDFLEGLSGFRKVQVVTNLTIDPSEVVARLRTITTHRVLFECSYHEQAIDFQSFMARVNLIKEEGLLGSVRIVDINATRTSNYIKSFALNGIKIQTLYQVGMKGKEVLVMNNPEASNLYRKPPVLCRTKLVLFAPNGDVYNCHTKLYWGDSASSFGNVASGFSIPDDYCICHDYGYCHPCQIGYIDIKTNDVMNETGRKYRILPSNPPPRVIKSR